MTWTYYKERGQDIIFYKTKNDRDAFRYYFEQSVWEPAFYKNLSYLSLILEKISREEFNAWLMLKELSK